MKQKILFVLPFNPYPLTSGGSQAIFNGIDVVRDEFDVYITFESFAEDEDNVANLKTLMGDNVAVLPYVVPATKKIKPTLKQKLYRLLFKTEKKLRKLAGYDFTPVRIPHKSWLHEELCPKGICFANYVLKLVEENEIDIVQCEMLCNVTIGMMLPKKVRKIFLHHELGWVVHELELMQQKGDSFEQKMFLEHYKCCEVALLNTYDDIITLSAIDTQKLLDAGVKSQIHTSMAVVNTSNDTLVSTERGNVLSFVGPDCNLPNIAGLKWFLDNVWEQILQKDSYYRLQIIGRWNEKRIAELIEGRENVKYLGFVENLQPVLKDTIMIVPITIGSGIRMKILEAASMGVPFVTTTVGVEGIPVENGVHCLIADTPENFFEAVLKLQDGETRKRLAVNANRLVTDRFSMATLKKNRSEIYSNMN